MMMTGMDMTEENVDAMNISDVHEVRVYSGKHKQTYYSNIVGEYIQDAITGAKYPWKVGSLNERRFFKVISTNAHSNLERKGVSDSSGNRSSMQAFYDSPQAYMKYHNVTLNKETIDNWYLQIQKLYPEKYNTLIGGMD